MQNVSNFKKPDDWSSIERIINAETYNCKLNDTPSLKIGS